MPSNYILDEKENVRSRVSINYRVINPIGRGGNSEVYIVLSNNGQFAGCIFALKLFTRINESTRLERFEREKSLLKEINHPSIMRLYDEGTITKRENGQEASYPFIIAEYMPYTVANVNHNNTTIIELLSYSSQLLSALSLLDSRDPKVIHRDIKPRNIFLKSRSCILGDFGLIKFLDESDADDNWHLTFAGENVGPIGYRTPDLVEYKKNKIAITTKSDIYQLGLVFAEMYTGMNPQKPTNNYTTQIKMRSLRDINGIFGDRIKELINAMLQKDPSDRPTADNLRNEFKGLFSESTDRIIELEGRIFQ